MAVACQITNTKNNQPKESGGVCGIKVAGVPDRMALLVCSEYNGINTTKDTEK